MFFRVIENLEWTGPTFLRHVSYLVRLTQKYATMITKTKIKAPPTVSKTAKMGVNFNSPTVVKADSPGEDLRWLTGALAVKAWMRMGSERPLALLLEMETQ